MKKFILFTALVLQSFGSFAAVLTIQPGESTGNCTIVMGHKYCQNDNNQNDGGTCYIAMGHRFCDNSLAHATTTATGFGTAPATQTANFYCSVCYTDDQRVAETCKESAQASAEQTCKAQGYSGAVVQSLASTLRNRGGFCYDRYSGGRAATLILKTDFTCTP